MTALPCPPADCERLPNPATRHPSPAAVAARVLGLLIVLVAQPVGAATSQDHEALLDVRLGGRAPALPPPSRAISPTAMRAAQTVLSNPTLPHFSYSYKFGGKTYPATLLGGSPFVGQRTTIPVVIVPVRITVTNYATATGPAVSDGSLAIPSLLASPIFHTTNFANGQRQFADALLRASLPFAPAGYGMTLTARVDSTLNISTTTVNATVRRSATGQQVISVNGAAVLQPAFAKRLAIYDGNSLVLFLTYNAVDKTYAGYHDATTISGRGTIVWAYAAWLTNASDLFLRWFPDAVTVSHEIAEIVEDPYPAQAPSMTAQWGDPFNANKCVSPYMEGGDVTETASANAIRYTLTGSGYSVANIATLAWFMHPANSPGFSWTYSFPNTAALTQPSTIPCKVF